MTIEDKLTVICSISILLLILGGLAIPVKAQPFTCPSTETPTAEVTLTSTNIIATPTGTDTPTIMEEVTITPTLIGTWTPTQTFVETNTETPTRVISETPTETRWPSETPTLTPTNTPWFDRTTPLPGHG